MFSPYVHKHEIIEDGDDGEMFDTYKNVYPEKYSFKVRNSVPKPSS